jgi:hypothetical protein
MLCIFLVLLFILLPVRAQEEIVITHNPDLVSKVTQDDESKEVTIELGAQPTPTIHIVNNNSNINRAAVQQVPPNVQQEAQKNGDLAETSFAFIVLGALAAGAVGAGRVILENAPKILSNPRLQ